MFTSSVCRSHFSLYEKMLHPITEPFTISLLQNSGDSCKQMKLCKQWLLSYGASNLMFFARKVSMWNQKTCHSLFSSDMLLHDFLQSWISSQSTNIQFKTSPHSYRKHLFTCLLCYFTNRLVVLIASLKIRLLSRACDFFLQPNLFYVLCNYFVLKKLLIAVYKDKESYLFHVQIFFFRCRTRHFTLQIQTIHFDKAFYK